MGYCDHEETVKVERNVDGNVLQKQDASCFLSSRVDFLDPNTLLLKVVFHWLLVFSPLLSLCVQERWSHQE